MDKTSDLIKQILASKGIDPNMQIKRIVVGIGTEETVTVSAFQLLEGAIILVLDEIERTGI